MFAGSDDAETNSVKEKHTMKIMTIRRALRTALAAFMALLVLTVPAAAQTAAGTWEKTKPFKSSFCSFLAKPGQYIVKSVLLPRLLGDLEVALQGVTEGLYTNDTVNTILLAQRSIEFVISQGSATSRQFLRPFKVADAIRAWPDTKEKYEAAAAALDTVMIGGKTGGNAADTAKEWAAVDTLIAEGALDWGVTGRESFVEAAGLALRPLLNLLCHRTLNFRGKDGVYAAAIVPGLEALGCKDILSIEEFEETYLKAMKAAGPITGMFADITAISAKMKSDFALAAILNPVLDLLEELQADPQGKLISLLPNVAYRRDDITALFGAGIENDGQTTKIFENLGGAFGLDLSGTFEEVLQGALVGLPLQLPPIPWDVLAGAGDLDEVTNTVIADTDLVYAVLTDYVGHAIDSDPQGVRNLITESMGIPSWASFFVYYLLKGVMFFAKIGV